MTKRRAGRPIRRIVVALGPEGSRGPALEAAAELAAGMEAEIAGLFVEDINLLRLAELPFARQFSCFASVERRVESPDLERQLRVQARAAERALVAAAEHAGVSWSFRVSRGLLAAELSAAAKEADMLALGTIQHSLLGPGEFGAMAEGAAGRRRRAGVREERTGPGPIVAVFNRSPAAERALEVAARLARANHRPLMVLIVAGTGQTADRLRLRASELLGEARSHFRRLIRPTFQKLLDAVRAEGGCLMVLDASKTVLEQSAIRALHERLDCAVLLVR